MATTAAEAVPRLTDEQLVALLALIKDADSVELKMTMPGGDQRAATRALGIDPLDAQIRQVFFFDTPDLALNRAGLVVRARRIQGGQGDSVVKLRPVIPAELPDDLRHSPSFVVEVDAMPGGYVCSASLKGKSSADEVRATALGEAPIRKVFTKEQRAFYADHAPAGLELDNLAVLGPVFVLKLKFSPDGYGRPIVAEMWLYPDGSRIIELSTKCLPHEAFQVAAETRAFLSSRGITNSDQQSTKTKTALEYFSGLLQAPAAE